MASLTRASVWNSGNQTVDCLLADSRLHCFVYWLVPFEVASKFDFSHTCTVVTMDYKLATVIPVMTLTFRKSALIGCLLVLLLSLVWLSVMQGKHTSCGMSIGHILCICVFVPLSMAVGDIVCLCHDPRWFKLGAWLSFLFVPALSDWGHIVLRLFICTWTLTLAVMFDLY